MKNMHGFTVESAMKSWPKMFEAATSEWGEGNEKLARDLLAAAKKLAVAATDALAETVPSVTAETAKEVGAVAQDPTVRVQVLADDTGGYVRFMLDVYVTP